MLQIVRTFCIAVMLLLSLSGKSVSKLAYLEHTTENGNRYVIVSGEFEFGDDLGDFIRTVERHDPLGVTFESVGGNIAKALELGRLIRYLNLSTVQPRGPECISACAFAFMGGVQRFAQPGAIGVHKSSLSDDHSVDVNSAVSAVQQMTAEIIQYMDEMGVDPGLLKLALKYDADDVRYISKREMSEFGLTTSQVPGTQSESKASATPAPSQVNPQHERPTTFDKRIRVARTGVLRHPKGVANLKSGPNQQSASFGSLKNGTKVEILRSEGRWYFVSTGFHKGYLHHTWVRVDQFDHSPGLLRHIQVKSFDNYQAAVHYVRSSRIPLALYLVTNGWYAVTVAQPMDRAAAIELNLELKKTGYIPEDSFVTFGNTYMVRACCD